MIHSNGSDNQVKLKANNSLLNRFAFLEYVFYRPKYVKILQLRVNFQTAMVLYWRFILD